MSDSLLKTFTHETKTWLNFRSLEFTAKTVLSSTWGFVTYCYELWQVHRSAHCQGSVLNQSINQAITSTATVILHAAAPRID